MVLESAPPDLNLIILSFFFSAIVNSETFFISAAGFSTGGVISSATLGVS
jgi:hypothetical protein